LGISFDCHRAILTRKTFYGLLDGDSQQSLLAVGPLVLIEQSILF